MALMRSCLYVPGNSERMVAKAPQAGADVVVFDLEDSVSPDRKLAARHLVRGSLRAAGAAGSDVYVRVNGWDTLLTAEDLEGVVDPGLNGIVLAKCRSPEDVRRLAQALDALEGARGLPAGSVAIQLLIETAEGVMRSYESALASPRVNSLAFGALDYARDMRVALTSEGEELLHARAHIAIAARAARCVAIDYPFPAYEDEDGFERTALAGRALGYEGRTLIHPDQIAPCHRLYSPRDDAVEWARRIVDTFETEALAKGLGAIAVQGSMIDTPVYESARALLVVAAEIEEKDRLRAGKG